jgi:spore photoproduct lyase
MKPFPIKRLLIEEEAGDYRITSRILDHLKEIPTHRVGRERYGEGGTPDGLDKETLRLVRFPGALLKPCPGTQNYICCGYQILHIGTNCPMDCSYCILQAYVNQPSLRVHVNLEEELEAIGRLIDRHPDQIFRIGTGEFADSLALEPIVGWGNLLLPFFSKRKNALLELKTKSDQIEGLLSIPHRTRIVVSWSLNSPHIVANEEHQTAPLMARLKAARRCQSEGFLVGLHFDPLIEHREWKEGFLRCLDLMDRNIDPKRVIWISLGCFRYMPSLKPIIRRRHPGSPILQGEFIPGLDGKMRYFKPIRVDMYRFVVEQLKEWYRSRGIYLCMESDEVWKKSMDWSPGNSAGLSDYLDERVIEMY